MALLVQGVSLKNLKGKETSVTFKLKTLVTEVEWTNLDTIRIEKNQDKKVINKTREWSCSLSTIRLTTTSAIMITKDDNRNKSHSIIQMRDINKMIWK